jgi:succinyl-diaminopimelate desuccinylase
MRVSEEAKKIIRINSVTENGNEELANYLSTLLKSRGFHKVQLQQVSHSIDGISKRQFNVIAVIGDSLVDRKIKKGLLLNTHLDTVSPGIFENWSETSGDPFALTAKDGKIFGLGTADVKLDFLCKMRAAEKFKEKKLKMPIYLVGTCGEEVGMFGAKYLIKSGALNPKHVMVGEPSELKVIYAHKCLNIYRVSIHYQQTEKDARGFNRKIDLVTLGKSAHGSYPHLGVNAIHASFEFLQKAMANGFEIRFTHMEGGDTVNKVADRSAIQFYLTSHALEDFKRFFRDYVRSTQQEKMFKVELGGIGESGVKFLPDELFSCTLDVVEVFKKVAKDFEKVKDNTYNPAHSTVNFGRLVKTSNGIEVMFDLRLLPDLTPESIEQHIKGEVQKIASKFPSMNIAVKLERENPSLNMQLDNPWLQMCKEAMVSAGLQPVFDKKATSTEAAQYFQAGYDAVIFGPGLSHGNSHSPNEFNYFEHLEKATLFYEKLIERVCL